ncbi:flavin reductase [Agrobacterium tumefaciens]|uniref:flavin reductase n=1 Tax=Agrobacterium tumefaciens TaxID=358 RepID=UPI0030138FE6
MWRRNKSCKTNAPPWHAHRFSGAQVNRHIASVDLQKASKLLNHGPTVLVSTSFRCESNVMAAAWVCVLDSSPLQLTLVVDKTTRTRELIENSASFVVQVRRRDRRK